MNKYRATFIHKSHKPLKVTYLTAENEIEAYYKAENRYKANGWCDRFEFADINIELIGEEGTWAYQ